MYPKEFADHFRQFDTTQEVFVGMPFGDTYKERWRRIFSPAIKRAGLAPLRVDMKTVGDSILMGILDGIAHSKLLLFDISFVDGPKKPFGPSPNVLYELGLAHAQRLAQEIVVVRDKAKGSSAFDIQHIRYHEFDPGRVQSSVRLIARLLKQSASELDRTRDHLVKAAFRSLDPDMLRFIHSVRDLADGFDLAAFDSSRNGQYALGPRDATESRLRAIARALIARGILQAGDHQKASSFTYGGSDEYTITGLGQGVLRYLPRWLKDEERIAKVPPKKRLREIQRLAVKALGRRG